MRWPQSHVIMASAKNAADDVVLNDDVAAMIAQLGLATRARAGSSDSDSSGGGFYSDPDEPPPPATASASAPAPPPQRIANPVALVACDDPYVRALVVRALRRRKHWRVLDVPTPADIARRQAKNTDAAGVAKTAGRIDAGGAAAAAAGCLAVGYRGRYHYAWSDYEHIDWEEVAAGRVLAASCLYNRKGLIRKGHLAHTMRVWSAKRPGRARIHPESFVLSLDGDAGFDPATPPTAAAVVAAAVRSGFPGFAPGGGDADGDGEDASGGGGGNGGANGGGDGDGGKADAETWILKPSVTNQTQGIRLVRSHAALAAAVRAADALHRAGGFVLQRYVPPLLVNGRKFHLRVFALVHGSLAVRVFPDFLFLSSLEPYAGAPLGNLRAHLSNICHQKGGAALSAAEFGAAMRRWDDLGPDLVASGLCADAAGARARIAGVRARVCAVIGECLEAVSGELTFQPRPNCFEIFGFDLMLDPQWRVWLLEANAEPDLSKAGDALQHVVDNVVERAVELTVDHDPRFAPPPPAAGAAGANDGGGSGDGDDLTVPVVVLERAPRGW